MEQSKVDEVLDLMKRSSGGGCGCEDCRTARMEMVKRILQAEVEKLPMPTPPEVPFHMGGLYRYNGSQTRISILSYGGSAFQLTELDGCRYHSESNISQRDMQVILNYEMTYLGQASKLLQLQ